MSSGMYQQRERRAGRRKQPRCDDRCNGMVKPTGGAPTSMANSSSESTMASPSRWGFRPRSLRVGGGEVLAVCLNLTNSVQISRLL